MTEGKMEPETIEESILAFQKGFSGVDKTRDNTFTNSKYASLDDVWNAAKPLLLSLKLCVKSSINNGELCVSITNKDGASLHSAVRLPDSTDSFQKFGSALTYYRRYLLCAMLGIVEADDDDGNAGEVKPAEKRISEKQLGAIVDLMAATETQESALLQYIDATYNKGKLEDLTYPEAAVIVKMLKQKQQKKVAA